MNPSNFQIFTEALLSHMDRQEAQATAANELLRQVVQEQRDTRWDNQYFLRQQRALNQRLANLLGEAS